MEYMRQGCLLHACGDPFFFGYSVSAERTAG